MQRKKQSVFAVFTSSQKLAVCSNLTCPCAFYPPELSGVLHQCHILASEMVHFIHQMQYYITFEVRPLTVLPLLWAVKHQRKVAITESLLCLVNSMLRDSDLCFFWLTSRGRYLYFNFSELQKRSLYKTQLKETFFCCLFIKYYLFIFYL